MEQNILAIGNSFSRDATRYLHGVARAAGVRLNVANLYIGGCSLALHYRNMLGEKAAYTLDYNGMETDFSVSLQEALLNRDWDVVTLQQASRSSTRYSSFEPYLGALITFVRRYAPKARVYLHETWAYKPDSDRLRHKMGYETHGDMYRDIHAAYARAAQENQVDGVIPSGALIERMVREPSLPNLYYDEFHASRGLGRYALSLVWFRTLTGASVSGNTFRDFDEPIDEADVLTAQRMADTLL